MKIKDLRCKVSSATIIDVRFARDKRDAINDVSYHTVSIVGLYDHDKLNDFDIEFIYPREKDILEAWVVFDGNTEDL